jgi:S1-C subfamily serine protease
MWGALFNTPARAQPFNILMQMMETQQAIVEVHAINTDVFEPSQAVAGINPETGRLVIINRRPVAQYERGGSGVIIHPSGIIVTNAHTVYRANRVQVNLDDGQTFPAKIIKFVNAMDLALLKIDTPELLPFVDIANSDSIRLGQDVITIGNSPLLKETVSGGKIIGLGIERTVQPSGIRRTGLIQTTVNLYQGDSGGPLFNDQGDLIGLMTADEGSRDHSSFAIPSNRIYQYLLEYLHAQGEKSN